MTPSDAADLLGHCAAFDRRTVGEVDARAWAAALADVPADADTYAAVARFYGTPPRDGDGRRWIEPHHVRTMRKAIRAERHGDTIAAYDSPDPDESGPEFVERRREQLEAIGDGRLEPTPVRQLAGGPHPAVADAIGVRTVDDTLAEPAYVPPGFREAVGMPARPPELSRPCPPAAEGGCGARERQPCVSPRGRRRSTVHAARLRTTGGEQ